MQAVAYVASVIGGRKDVHVCLLHVPTPFPAELREAPWTDAPAMMERAQEELRESQAQWREKEESAAQIIFSQAKAILHKGGLPPLAVETQLSACCWAHTVADDILDAAREKRCKTVVVGREAFTMLETLLKRHVGDMLIRKGKELTLWIVE